MIVKGPFKVKIMRGGANFGRYYVCKLDSYEILEQHASQDRDSRFYITYLNGSVDIITARGLPQIIERLPDNAAELDAAHQLAMKEKRAAGRRAKFLARKKS